MSRRHSQLSVYYPGSYAIKQLTMPGQQQQGSLLNPCIVHAHKSNIYLQQFGAQLQED